MNKILHSIILADDDEDDCIFFQEALNELDLDVEFTTVHHGVALINMLQSMESNFPDVIFLDLNMPKKTGFECLAEIKANNKLKNVPVVIISTSMDLVAIDLLYKGGAHYYIKKPGHFVELKKVIEKALSVVAEDYHHQPIKAKFIIAP